MNLRRLRFPSASGAAIRAVLAVAVIGLSGAAAAQDSELHQAGHSFHEGLRATGHAIHHGVRATGHAIHRGVRATGHAIHHGVRATGHAIHRTVDGHETPQPRSASTTTHP